jgi:LacI family transcriptional regulator
MGRRVMMQEVAAEAGVSVSTVSKVINNRYGVASETVHNVTEVINRLGYEASLVARSLRNSRTNVIGVLVADFEPFSTEVLKGAADAPAAPASSSLPTPPAAGSTGTSAGSAGISRG